MKPKLVTSLVLVALLGVLSVALAHRAPRTVGPSGAAAWSPDSDPDYCQGIACTESTDTCCDESVR